MPRHLHEHISPFANEETQIQKEVVTFPGPG